MIPARHQNFGRLVFANVLLPGLIAGCGPRLEPVFPPPPQRVVWPPPPLPSRVEYVGQLRTSADLKRPRGFFENFGALFLGPEEPEVLYGPRSVVVTPDGERVWIADPGGRCLHLFDLAERRYLRVPSAGDAPLLTPVHVSLGPPGSIHVCDSEAIAIHRLSDRTGQLVQALRLPEELLRPVASAFDPSRSELHVTDAVAHDLKVLALDGSLIRILGTRGAGPGEFNFPTDVVFKNDSLWLADTGNYRVQRISVKGEPIAVLGRPGDAPGDFAMPKSVGLDSEGHLYVVDGRFENVQVFDADGRLLLVFGEEGTGPGEFWLPGGMHIDGLDRIWICDTYNRRVQLMQYLPAAQDSEKGGEER